MQPRRKLHDSAVAGPLLGAGADQLHPLITGAPAASRRLATTAPLLWPHGWAGALLRVGAQAACRGLPTDAATPPVGVAGGVATGAAVLSVLTSIVSVAGGEPGSPCLVPGEL
ncbi:holin [Micromonospora sp. NPDC001898]|uniref:holin n=1 Tax=Micromonospora sp. NPDC001898 TaxID=3364221 RepID=UPI00368EE280